MNSVADKIQDKEYRVIVNEGVKVTGAHPAMVNELGFMKFIYYRGRLEQGRIYDICNVLEMEIEGTL